MPGDIDISGEVIKTAVRLAKKIKASAILVLTETGESFDVLSSQNIKIPVIGATADDETFDQLVKKAMISTLDIEFLDIEEKKQEKKRTKRSGKSKTKEFAIKLLTRDASGTARIEDALVVAFHKGIICEKDLVIALGSTISGEATSISVYKIDRDRLDFTLYDLIKLSDIKQEVFEATLNIALEIGREGREGRLIGTAFLLGDSKNVMKKSRQLILNPFEGHIIGERMISEPEIAETIKELAQLDGAFVVTEDGVIEAAGRYLNVDTSKVDIARGLGARHAAVAAITSVTRAVGITVSQSGGIVRVFRNGKVHMAIEPKRKITLRTESLKRTFRKI